MADMQDRYFSPERLLPFLEEWKDLFPIVPLATSVEQRPIYGLTLGQGKTKLLLWSQMHGNESTTTRALMHLITWLLEPAQSELLHTLSIHIIPQLNPDGAQAYTRHNAVGVDLNRDAIALSQPESQCLRTYFDRLQPDYCFNLHDQRTIYGAGVSGAAATLSFLAPAADAQCSVTPARQKAMQLIAAISAELKEVLPKGIGRFDDAFNPNCVGDTFSTLGVPTLLVEAGHFANDYARNKTVTCVEQALQKALWSIAKQDFDAYSTADYLEIPENQKVYYDLLLQEANLEVEGQKRPHQYLILQYLEVLKEGRLYFEPQMIDHSASKPSQQFHRIVELTPKQRQNPIVFEIDKILKNPPFDKLLSINS